MSAIYGDATNHFIHILGQQNPQPDLLGGKGATLSQLKQKGFPVPPGFILSTNCYKDFLEQNNLTSLAESVLKDSQAANELRKAILAAPLSEELVQTTIATWRNHLQGLACAVRSSAIAEDTGITSFAGQHTTSLQVTNETQLIQAVKLCWASLWSESAIAYRRNQDQPLMAVIIQQMIPAQASGVLFTVNPIGSQEDVLVEANWGLGEAVVASLVTPDCYLVGRNNLKIQAIAREKTIQIVPAEQGVKQIPVAKADRDRRVLDDTTLLKIVRLGLAIEKLITCPQDIEWCYANEQLYILQARPITTSPNSKTIWSCTNTREVVPGVMSPLSQVVTKTALDRGIDRFMANLSINIPLPAEGIFNFHCGRFYMNMDYMLNAGSQMPGGTARIMAEALGYDLRYYQGNPDTQKLVNLRSLWKTLQLLYQFPRQIHRNIPKIEADLEQVWRLDLANLSLETIATRIEQAIALTNEVVSFHVSSSLIAGSFWNRLEKILQPSFGEQSRAILSHLTSGLENMVTAEIGFSLQRLAQIAAQEEPIRQAILSSEPETALNNLRMTKQNFSFFPNWDNFLQRFGNRTFSELDMQHPRWSDDPQFLLQVIQSYLRYPDQETPEARMKRQRQEQEKVRLQVKEQIPAPFYFPIFNYLLKNAQFYLEQRENMRDLWVRSYAVLRRLYLEVAQRWQSQGCLNSLDDIFFLLPAEIDQAIAGSLTGKQLNEKVLKRRQQYQRDLNLNPPETIIGEWQPQITPFSGALSHTEEGLVLQGLGCSPGIVTTTACIIKEPITEAHRLQKGDILVTVQIDPAWTPLFLNAGGIVTELGGLLSHSAIVAREYGIPAVFGVKGATKQILDGQRLTIDGMTGTIKIYSVDTLC